MLFVLQEKMVISLKSFGGALCHIAFPILLVSYQCEPAHHLLSIFEEFIFLLLTFFSTKDPGQKPFSFKIGQGSVIKGNSSHPFLRRHPKQKGKKRNIKRTPSREAQT